MDVTRLFFNEAKKHLKSPSGRRGKIGRGVFHNPFFFRYEIIQKNFRGGSKESAFFISSDQLPEPF
jgi:hypothetical protein